MSEAAYVMNRYPVITAVWMEARSGSVGCLTGLFAFVPAYMLAVTAENETERYSVAMKHFLQLERRNIPGKSTCVQEDDDGRAS
ncbi:hypothetical protein [Paenibacillus sp. Y412MC10]|uniref:hypothetical protein n=1 Tax=Geobacillus sp. (strain Y412MC10) TaxID=481743 RepID=UPI0011AA8C05|nr:hypothetical protein [Paenibacillus sp. Y412MC10]